MATTYDLDALKPKYGEAVMFPAVLEANRVYSKGTVLGEVTSNAASAVQTITRSGTPATGSFQLSFGDSVKYQTAVISTYTAAALQAALEALPNIGTGNVTVALATNVYTITFTGALANKPQPLLAQVANSLQTSAPAAVTLSFATTTTGVQKGAYGPYDDALSNGKETARAILPVACATGPDGRISLSAVAGGGEHGETRMDVAVAVMGGIWDTSKLVGLDANGVADLGRLVQGSVASGLLALR